MREALCFKIGLLPQTDMWAHNLKAVIPSSHPKQDPAAGLTHPGTWGSSSIVPPTLVSYQETEKRGIPESRRKISLVLQLSI